MTTYYVSTTGNDSNSGTSVALPFATISYVASIVNPGDIVYVRGGTYSETVNITRSGSLGNYITFTNYPGETPILDGSNLGGDFIGLFTCNQSNYIQIIGFRLQNYYANTGYHGFGVYIYSSHHVLVKNNYIYRTASSGIFIYNNLFNNQYLYNNEDIVIDGNTLEETNYKTDLTIGVAYEEGISLVLTNNFLIKNNTLINTMKEGIDVKNGSSYGVLNGNKIQGGGNAYAQGSNGILLDPNGLNSTNVEVSRSYTTGRGNGIAIATEAGGTFSNIGIYNNICVNNANGIVVAGWGTGAVSNINIVNNTVYGNTNSGIGIGTSSHSNILIRNNISYNNSNYQLILQGDEVEDHNLTYTDPLFVNSALGDFHLQSGSPAIDTGTCTGAPSVDFDGASRPYGTTCDIGAYEYGAVSTTPSPTPPIPTGNLIINPGFEIGQSPWVTRQTGTLATFSFTSAGRTSTYSASITYPSRESGAVAAIRQSVPVQPNTNYTLSGWMTLSNIVGIGAIFYIDWYDSASVYISAPGDITPYYITGTQAWTFYTGQLTSPSNAGYAVVTLEIYDSSGQAWFDDLFFGIPVPSTSTPTPSPSPTPVPICNNPTYNLALL